MKYSWTSPPAIACIVFVFLCAGAFVRSQMRVSQIRLGTDAITVQQAYWEGQIKRLGGNAAYQEFARSVATSTPQSQHAQAHIFGGALYQVEGLSGLATCDSQFSFGCFHESLGRAISSLGLSVVTQLNEECFKGAGNAPLACQHGIGHGIVAYIGYDLSSLKKSLAICKTLPGIHPVGGCYGGAYMEFNMRTMLGSEGSPREDNSDLLSPCDRLDASDQPACYFWQPLWWHIVFDRQGIHDQLKNYTKIGALCADVPVDSRSRCFEGIGNNIPVDIQAATSVEEVGRNLCVAAAPVIEDRVHCLSFLAKSLLNGGAGIKGDALLVCYGLPGEEYQYCASAAGHDLVVPTAGNAAQ